MDYKMDCDRLNKDELTYELKIRGFTDVSNVQEMRSRLRYLLRMEQSGQTLTYPKSTLKCDEEFKIITDKIKEIRALIVELKSPSRKSGPYKKIETKLGHILKRTDRTISGKEDEDKTRVSLLSEIFELGSQLETRIENLERESASLSMLDASLKDVDLGESDSNSVDDDGAAANMSTSIRKSVSSTSTVKSVPVVKWNVSFTGDVKQVSVSAFLERIEELCIARHVSKDDLFDSAVDLFKGQALVWFRANRKDFKDWDSLAKAMKIQFQPYDYDERLYDEIKRRTQGQDEPIGIYLAVMTNLFNRMSISIPEQTQLRILLKNISPFYQINLGLVEINNIDELKNLCAKIERKKHTIDNFAAPSRKKCDLEPDLAYVTSVQESSNNAIATTSGTSMKCWNCNQLGHRSAQCNQSKRKHCYRCGEPNVTVKSCGKCNSNPGNDYRDH